MEHVLPGLSWREELKPLLLLQSPRLGLKLTAATLDDASGRTAESKFVLSGAAHAASTAAQPVVKYTFSLGDLLDDWAKRPEGKGSARQASLSHRKLPLRSRQRREGFSCKKPMMVSSEYHS